MNTELILLLVAIGLFLGWTATGYYLVSRSAREAERAENPSDADREAAEYRGMTAYDIGLDFYTGNPYPITSGLGEAWRRGWKTARNLYYIEGNLFMKAFDTGLIGTGYA